jgi:transposase
MSVCWRPSGTGGAPAQAALSVIRARESLVEARTKLINAVRGLLKSCGARVNKGASESFPKQANGQVPEILRPAVGPLLETIDTLSEQIAYYDQLLKHLAQTRYPETELLTQVPGVGTLTALAFRLTIDDAGRFRRSRDVGGYLGLRPRQQDSGEQRPQLRITKAGDRYLRSTLVNCAHHILGPFGADTDLRRWGLKLCERGGKNAKKRAIVAVARKLAVLLHHLWVSGEVYEPLRHPAADSLAA